MAIYKNYFFEFSGMPKAGKTTTIENIRHLLKRLGYNVINFAGHDRNIGIDKSNSRELNIVLASRAVEYLVANSVNTCKPSIFLLDRGIFDRSVFTQMVYNHGKISEEEKNTLFQYLLLPNNCKLIDGLFVFNVSPEISLQREYSKTLLELPGRVMNSEVLGDYQIALKMNYEKFSSLFVKSFWIDTSNSSARETGIKIAKIIWQIIGEKENEFPIL